MTKEDIQRMSGNYFGKIKLVDGWIGRIFEAYEAHGWLDDLVIIFWSDHGEMLGDHGRLYKRIFFESSLRVPLMIRWPGRISKGVRSDALAENIDIFPTLLEGLGLEHDGRCQGRSLWPHFEDQSVRIRECQLSEVEKHIMVCTEQYKYAVDPEARGILLFDLKEDPQEQNNLVGKSEHADLEHTMREMLFARLVTAQYELPAFQK
jgi:arylsulfatase A-like enzyme